MKRLAVLVVLSLAGCKPAPEAATTAAAPPAPVVVTTAPVESRTLQRTVQVVGSLAGFEEVLISPKVDGRVLSVEADVGDPVIPGSPLLILDPTDLKLEVESARRSLEAELARLGLTALPAGELLVEEVPSVRRATVAVASAQLEVNRIKTLTVSTSPREFDLADNELKAADAAKRDAVTQARATLSTARLRQAALETAEQHLRDATLTAPIPTGWLAWSALVGPGATPLRYTVAQRLVSEGEMVRSNPVTNAFRLVMDHSLKLRAAVPEQFAADIRVGQSVELRVDAYASRAFTGRVARINPTVDVITRTFQVEVAVPNFDGGLKAGGFARGAILTRQESGVKTVPPAALVSFAGVNKIFVVEAGKARAVEVQVGAREKDYLELLGPVPSPATVATSGFSQLVDGSAVAVRK